MTNIILKNSTVAGKVPLPIDLQPGELALNSADGLAFMKLNDGTVKTVGAGGPTPPPITPWVRNPSWLPMPNTTSAQEQVDILVAVYPESSYFAYSSNNSAGTFTVDWGDGSAPQSFTTGVLANYLYDYNAAGLAGTNGPVTFTFATQTVNRTAHGYTNGMKISFASIVTTTGIVQLQTYYVINATADTFQVSATSGGSAIPFSNNGTGAILPYKQAMVKVTPTIGGATLILVNLGLKNSTANLSSYSQPILDATISAACSSLTIGQTTVPPRLLERCTILRHNTSSMASLFGNCSSLQSVPLFNTASVTNMTSMFQGCSSLQSVPLFNTALVTNMSSMFQGCVNLIDVPLFVTNAVTNMSSMFNGCNSLTQIPLFNTQNVTLMNNMFQGCSSLQSVPLFNTIKVTDMSVMFSGCSSLIKVPLFDTANVTVMALNSLNGGMFSGCSSLQSVPLFNTSKVITFGGNTPTSGMFSGCNSLIQVPLFNTASVITISYMFNACVSLQTVPLFDTANVTTITGMFSGCSSLQIVPLFNTVKVTTFGSMFSGCTNIGSIPAFDTTAVTGTTAFNSMFNGCSSLQQIPDMNFNRAAITTSGSYTSMFTGCASLSKINLSPGNGPKFTFTVTSCKLSAASLNQLYTSLPTVSGQTITVTGNVGIAGDDPSIAVAKNWTVTGS
jgi:surface protein